MPKIPSVKISRLLKTLLHLGFVEHRQSGSHLQLKHPDGRRVTIPIHSGKDIKKGTLNGILKDIRITRDEFIEALRS